MRSIVPAGALVVVLFASSVLASPGRGGAFGARGFYGHSYGHGFSRGCYGYSRGCYGFSRGWYGYPYGYWGHGGCSSFAFGFGFGGLYAPAPVYVAPPPVAYYTYAPPVLAPQPVVAEQPATVEPPPVAAQPAPPAQQTPSFVQTNIRFHQHGDDKGKVDWVEGLLDGRPVRIYYDDFGRVRKQKWLD